MNDHQREIDRRAAVALCRGAGIVSVIRLTPDRREALSLLESDTAGCGGMKAEEAAMLYAAAIYSLQHSVELWKQTVPGFGGMLSKATRALDPQPFEGQWQLFKQKQKRRP